MTHVANSPAVRLASPPVRRVLPATDGAASRDARKDATSVRALFVASTTEIGGAETALLALFRNFDRNTLQPVFASLEFGEGRLPQRIEELGVPVNRLPRGRMRNPLATIRKVRALARLIRELQIEVVVANGGHPLLYARAAAWITQRPCVWWVHQAFPADPLAEGPLGALELALGANALVANSQRTATALRCHFQNSQISVIFPGVDAKAFENCEAHRSHVRHDLGFQQHELVAGLFGRLQRNKGQHLALQALFELRRRGIPAKLLIVGSEQFGLDAGYQQDLLTFVRKHCLQDDVRFLGQREDIPELLCACDVALQPATVPESFGLTVLEAMAAGVPVIAARHGGPLEVIQEGVTGAFHHPGDPLSLAGQIERMFVDRTFRQRVACGARKHVREIHTSERTARSFENLLRGLARRQNRAVGSERV